MTHDDETNHTTRNTQHTKVAGYLDVMLKIMTSAYDVNVINNPTLLYILRLMTL